MLTLRTWVILGMLLVLTSLPLVVVPGMGAGEVNQSQASWALAESEAAVVSAYQAVANAGAAGANVSGLLVRLNEAGELLAEAQVDSRLGKLDQAVYLADLCRETFVSVQGQADELWAQSYGSNLIRVWGTVFGSLAGVLLIVLGGFLSWRSFKRRYYKQALRMRPEVTDDES